MSRVGFNSGQFAIFNVYGPSIIVKLESALINLIIFNYFEIPCSNSHACHLIASEAHMSFGFEQIIIQLKTITIIMPFQLTKINEFVVLGKYEP